MIIKKIIDLCKKRGICYLYDGADVQYISDGAAIYPMYNLPRFDENTLCRTYDITDTQQGKIHFSHDRNLPINIDLSDNTDSETLCQKGPMVLSIAGGGAVPYITSQGLMFINAKYFAPLSDVRDNMLEVYERISTSGKTYFVIKSGFVLLAAVTPYEVITREFIEDLSTLTNMCKVALENQQLSNKPKSQQLKMFDEEGTE